MNPPNLKYLENVLVLNFNYTSTFEEYLKGRRPDTRRLSDAKINYIHGKIDDKGHPIIFGFGDEIDKQYETIENEKTKGFLKYIKSFWYLKTSNYHELIRFVETKEFQVFVLGHSCGLSDRTMLNEIFEHKNCKSIKIYYHEWTAGENNFTELTEDISRHFKDKGMFRRKLVNFKYCNPMPQL